MLNAESNDHTNIAVRLIMLQDMFVMSLMWLVQIYSQFSLDNLSVCLHGRTHTRAHVQQKI